jgi:CheY-like chemotaxis protein
MSASPPPPREPFPSEPGSNISRRNEALRSSGEALHTVLRDARRFAERSAKKHSPRLVLLADDDDDHRALLGETLGELGFGVEEATDGTTAIAKAIDLSPDVIVMDYRMPNMSGGDAARELAADARTRSIPILLLSGFPEAIPREVRLSCAAFLAKPCAGDELGYLLHLIVAVHRPSST